jgi:hypothetical protein
MIEKVQVLINDNEYFKVTNITLQEVIEGFLSIRTANINTVFNNIKTREFSSLLAIKGLLPIKIVVNGKVWQDSYITQGSLDEQKNSNGGTTVSINVSDVFKTLLTSDVIDVYYQTHKTLQIAIARTLTELGFTDFKIKNGDNIASIDLKNGGNKKNIRGGSCQDFLGGMCSIYKVLLKSNGIDTLIIESHNGNQSIVDKVYVLTDSNGIAYKSNAQFVQKTGDSNGATSRVIILNSSKNKDNNSTSVIVQFKNAMPFTQKIKVVSMEASYKQISNGITYELMSMTARANSHIYGLPNKVFDSNGNFFSTNSLVHILDEERGIDESMNIVGFSTTISDAGSNTTLNLVNQQAFDKLDNLKTKKSLLKK